MNRRPPTIFDAIVAVSSSESQQRIPDLDDRRRMVLDQLERLNQEYLESIPVTLTPRTIVSGEVVVLEAPYFALNSNVARRLKDTMSRHRVVHIKMRITDLSGVDMELNSDEGETRNSIILPAIVAICSDLTILDSFINSYDLPPDYRIKPLVAMELAWLLLSSKRSTQTNPLVKPEEYSNLQSLKAALVQKGYSYTQQSEAEVLFTALTGRLTENMWLTNYNPELVSTYHPFSISLAAYALSLFMNDITRRGPINLANTSLAGLVSYGLRFNGDSEIAEQVRISTISWLQIEKIQEIPTMLRNYGIVPMMQPGDLLEYAMIDFPSYLSVLRRGSEIPIPFDITDPDSYDFLSLYTDVEIYSILGPLYDLTQDRNTRIGLVTRRLVAMGEEFRQQDWSFQFYQCGNTEGEYDGDTIKDKMYGIQGLQDIIVSYGTPTDYKCYTCWLLHENTAEGDLKIPMTNQEYENAVQEYTREGGRGQYKPPTFGLRDVKKLKALLESIPANRRPLSLPIIRDTVKTFQSHYSKYLASKIETEIRRNESAGITNDDSVTALIARLDIVIQNSNELKTLVGKLVNLRQNWSQFRGWENAIDNFLGWFVILGIWMRKWKGPGNEFPYQWINDSRQETLADTENERREYEARGEAVPRQIEERYRRLTEEQADVCHFDVKSLNYIREVVALQSLLEFELALYSDDEVQRTQRNLTKPKELHRIYLAWVLGLPGLNFDDPNNKNRISELASIFKDLYIVEWNTSNNEILFQEATMNKSSNRQLSEYIFTSLLPENDNRSHCMAEASRLIGKTSIYLHYAAGNWDPQYLNYYKPENQNRRAELYNGLIQGMQTSVLQNIQRLYSPNINDPRVREYIGGIAKPHDIRLNLHKLVGIGDQGSGYATDVFHGRARRNEDEQIDTRVYKKKYLLTISPFIQKWVRAPL